MGFALPLILSAALPEAAGAAAAFGGEAISWAGSGLTAADLASFANVASYAGTGLQAVGKIGEGASQSALAKYNANLASNNAEIAKRNSSMAAEAGDVEANMVQRQTRAKVGALTANQAASGIDLNSKTAVDVRSSADELGELDAITVRSNAARKAYGYQTDASSYEAQSNMDRAEAHNAETSSYINAGSTLLGGVGDSSLNYLRYKSAGGL